MLKPRGQQFGLGRGLELLASASKLSGLGLEVLASASRHSGTACSSTTDAASELATKWRRTALFGHYRTSSQPPEPGTDEPSKQLLHYITHINSDTFVHSSSLLAKLYGHFSVLQPLFDRLFCITASSAPVESFLSEQSYYDSSPGTHV